MKITFLTSLNNSKQRGGAYLRVRTIQKLYESIGFKTNILYQGNFKTKYTFPSLIKSIIYGKNTRVMFKESQTKIPSADFIHLDNLRHFSWKRNKAIPLLYNAHNLEFENFYSRKNTFISRLFKKYEIKKIKIAKCIWLCSQREKDIICEINPNLIPKSFIIPNLIDSRKYYSNSKKEYISFIGTLDYYPNIQAIDFLLDDLIPNLRNNIPNNLSFIIAGRNPINRHLQKCKNLDIIIKKDLSDHEITELYSKTKVLLVPLIEGSGTRLKIIEGLFSGAQILTTPLGTEGISDKNIIISDLKNFKQSLIKILKSSKSRDSAVTSDLLSKYDLNTWILNNNKKIKEAILK